MVNWRWYGLGGAPNILELKRDSDEYPIYVCLSRRHVEMECRDNYSDDEEFEEAVRLMFGQEGIQEKCPF